jgi:hypothetical protein
VVEINPELLVKKGMLPENLPPVYTSERLWSALPKNVVFNGSTVGEAAPYNASKRGGQRRLFHVPHPLFLVGQGEFFREHWEHIQVVLDRSKGSVSKPIVQEDADRHIRTTSHSELPAIRLRKLSRFRYCLITDVSRFYYSIYTHAFAWALNGKAQAKADPDPKSAGVFGNKLDLIVRQAQSRQTIGIPVGPDASRIISEIVLSAADARFQKSAGDVAYVRHVDDYWIGGNSTEECEKYLHQLRTALRHFELDINEVKTRILSTKFVFGEDWPADIEADLISGFKSKPDLVLALGRIIARATETNDDGIIKRAIRILDRDERWDEHWDILEHFLVQCAVQYPHSFEYVARVIAWRVRRGGDFDKELWVDIASETAMRAALVGRDSEVCWALWLCKELEVFLTTKLTNTIIENNGSLVLAFLAHFPKHKLARAKLYGSLRERVNGNPYCGSDWPLALELSHLRRSGDLDWVAAKKKLSEHLQTLHDGRLSIIDFSARPRVFASGDDGDNKPSRAIESFGDDYGNYEAEEDDEEEPSDGSFVYPWERRPKR